MKRIALLAGLVAAIAGCRTELPPQVSKEPRFERTELVVMRQVSGYSDIALMSEEEGTFIWTHQQVSPFGIQLSFGNAFNSFIIQLLLYILILLYRHLLL